MSSLPQPQPSFRYRAAPLMRSSSKGDEARRRWVPGEIAAGLRQVPPRPSGTLAIVEVTDADVVVFAPRGLEGFARISDMWGIVGATVDLWFWRVPRSTIPNAATHASNGCSGCGQRSIHGWSVASVPLAEPRWDRP